MILGMVYGIGPGFHRSTEPKHRAQVPCSPSKGLAASLVIGPVDPCGNPWENHRKTLGKWWLNVILWDLPSGKLT